MIGHNGQQTNYIYLDGDAVRRARITFSGKVESPYRGLAAFEKQDAAFFFAREAAADEILNRLRARADAPALLVVSGVSGAGKSSLLQAGVLPRVGEVARGSPALAARGAHAHPRTAYRARGPRGTAGEERCGEPAAGAPG